jgi:hypothetical protein
MFRKVSIEDRINRFLENYFDAKYIPLHPSDFNLLKLEGRLNSFPLPLYKLGTGGFEEKPE